MTNPLEHTIQRCPHDKENPYAQISRELIRDETISPACRWMLIYLLSMQDGWKVSVKQLWNHLKKFHGRSKVYALLDEAISAGYIKRQHNIVGNLRKGCTYYVSESPKFSKNVSDIPVLETPGCELPKIGTHKKEHISSSKEEDKKEQYKKKSAPPPHSADASDLCKFFIEKIKERNPKFKDPKIENWLKEFQNLLEIDKRDLQEIKEVIEWIHTNSFWKANCLSPQALRKHYDRMSMQRVAEFEKGAVEDNRAFSIDLKKKYPDRLKNLTITPKYAMNLGVGKELPFTLPIETFRNVLCQMFGGRYEPNRSREPSSEVESSSEE